MKGFFERYSLGILIVFLLAAPVLVLWAVWAIGTNSNRLSDWLPADVAETVDLKRFDAWFGDGAFVVVSWEGCRIATDAEPGDADGDDPRLARLAEMLVPAMEPEPVAGDSADSAQAMVDRWAAEFDAALAPQLAEAEPAASANLNGAPTAEECRAYFKRVVTSRSLLDTLTAPPLNLPPEEAVRRLTGNVIGSEGQACAIVFLSDEGFDHLRQSIGVRNPRWIDRNVPQGALFRALEACAIPLEEAHLGGPPVDNLAIDVEGQRTLARLALAAGGLGLVLAWWALRNVTLTVIVFVCGIISTCGATGAIWVTGSHADAIVLSTPSLIYVLTISGAIHLINYYREALRSGGPKGAAGRALAAGYKPAVLCNVTTAIGLLSLLASDLAPIRRFGTFSALGMVLMLGVLFLLLPAALEVFGRRRGFGLAVSAGSSPGRSAEETQQDGFVERCASRWARWTSRHYAWVCGGGLVVMLLLSLGISRIHTSVDLLKLFDGKTRILADYQWLEANIGRLVPLEVLIRFRADALEDGSGEAAAGRLSLLERAQIVDHVRGQIDRRFGTAGEGVIAPPMSAAAFLPDLATGRRGTAAVMRRRVLDVKLQSSRPALASSGYMAIDPATGDEIWRISLRVAAFENIDYGWMADEVRTLVDPLVARVANQVAGGDDEARAAAPAIEAIHTGAVPIVYKAQRALLDSLIESTVWSFATITPLLMLVTRGIFSGAVAMIPNLLPVLAVFGSMGWLGISVDIGCMMTASIALGVAVDDTIHFLSWYRHAQERTSTRVEAIELAFRSCSRPTIQAALVNGLGLSVFLLSTFVPTKQFGLLMLVILTCGAVAELVLLPALLASPLGRAFELKRSRGARNRNECRGSDSPDARTSGVGECESDRDGRNALGGPVAATDGDRPRLRVEDAAAHVRRGVRVARGAVGKDFGDAAGR